MSLEKKEKLENLMTDAKELLTLFEDLKEKADINNKSLILKHIDRTLIAKNILPFLDLKDIVNFRSTCKDINTAVSSTVALVSYYKAVNQRKGDLSNQNIMLKSIKDVNEMDDIQMELESVKRVNSILFRKNFNKNYLKINRKKLLTLFSSFLF